MSGRYTSIALLEGDDVPPIDDPLYDIMRGKHMEGRGPWPRKGEHRVSVETVNAVRTALSLALRIVLQPQSLPLVAKVLAGSDDQQAISLTCRAIRSVLAQLQWYIVLQDGLKAMSVYAKHFPANVGLDATDWARTIYIAREVVELLVAASKPVEANASPAAIAERNLNRSIMLMFTGTIIAHELVEALRLKVHAMINDDVPISLCESLEDRTQGGDSWWEVSLFGGEVGAMSFYNESSADNDDDDHGGEDSSSDAPWRRRRADGQPIECLPADHVAVLQNQHSKLDCPSTGTGHLPDTLCLSEYDDSRPVRMNVLDAWVSDAVENFEKGSFDNVQFPAPCDPDAPNKGEYALLRLRVPYYGHYPKCHRHGVDI